MVFYVYVGVIKPERLITWKENNKPFDILENEIKITGTDWPSFLSYASDLFTDKEQVDWGSFAYKATKPQLRKLIEMTNCEINGLERLPDENLGVVFIEMS